MTRQEILDFIDGLNVYKTKLKIYLQNHYPEIVKSILTKTKFLDDQNPFSKPPTFQERIYCLRHEIFSRILCIECKKNPTKFDTGSGSYKHLCSVSCASKNKDVIAKKKKTKFDKYGDENYVNVKKSKKTRQDKYGSYSPSDFKEKVEATLMRDHGDPHWNNPEKYKETCQAIFGVDHPMKNPEFAKQLLENFAKNHNGALTPFQEDSIKERTKIAQRARSLQFVKSNTIAKLLTSNTEYISKSSKDEFEFECYACGTHFKSRWRAGMLTKLCPKCFPKSETYGVSGAEIEITNYIREIIPQSWQVINGDKKITRSIIPPKEIDIVVKDDAGKFKLLIEYDGIYFHRYQDQVRNRLLEKTLLVENLGYELIHIFESDWLTRKDAIKNYLRFKLGVLQSITPDYNYKVLKISESEAYLFQCKNSTKVVSGSISFGLVQHDNLVAVLVASKTRYKKYGEDEVYELRNFCCSSKLELWNAFDLLLNRFEIEIKPKVVVASVDRRYWGRQQFEKCGFELDHVLSPATYYFKPNNVCLLVDQTTITQNGIREFAPNAFETSSVKASMKEAGWMQIQDCGKLVFAKHYS